LGGHEEAVTFAQAVIACDRAAAEPLVPAVARSRLEIVLADGIRIIADDGVDVSALARVIGAIEGR